MTELNILIVDDEAAICENMVDILELQGHRVDSFTCPVKALEHFGENSQAYDLVILDLRMPTMNGVELLKRFREIRPELPAILTTAYLDSDECTFQDRNLFETVLGKPVDVELLLRRVQTKEFPLVICVDDDIEFCENLREILETHRIRCECFQDFQTAQEELHRKQFDVALLDVRLPDVKISEAARSLKDLNPKIQSFLVTGFPDDVREELEGLGIQLVFEKPIQPEELLNSISIVRPASSPSNQDD